MKTEETKKMLEVISREIDELFDQLIGIVNPEVDSFLREEEHCMSKPDLLLLHEATDFVCIASVNLKELLEEELPNETTYKST